MSVLSTYIAYSLGWSKPVWNFSATTRIRCSGLANWSAVSASEKPFILASVSSAPVSGSITVPEKATRALTSETPCSAR